MIFWTDEALKARIEYLERELQAVLSRESSSARYYMDRASEMGQRAGIAEQRVKELEAERTVMLQAISGIGPTLLAALGKPASQPK